MKHRFSLSLFLLSCCMLLMSSCKMWDRLFPPKYGCPGNGKSVGAERILSGEKTPKAKKFKS
jgi:hypothetical protein